MSLKQIPFIRKLQTKSVLTLVTVITISTMILSTVLYTLSHKMVVKNTADKAFKIAEAAAGKIDAEQLKELKTASDEKKESYIKIRENLSYIREIAGARYIYTMRKAESGNFAYVVDGSSAEDMSHIGDEEELSDGYEQAHSGQIYIGDEIENQGSWGILISTYYPLKDSSGNTVAFLGVDYDAADVYQGLQTFKVLSVVISLIAIILIGIITIFIIRYITEPVTQITAVADRLANNDITVEK
jgi:HAMP domain.